MRDLEAEAGIWAKLDRARQHFEFLETEIGMFHDAHPYRIVKQGQPKPEVWTYGVRFDPPIPIQWSAVLGEIVHNLRSALDHCIYQLAADRLGKRPGDKTGFPIYDSEVEFINKGGGRQIKDCGPAVQSFVEGLQPYVSRSAVSLALLALNRLWSQDKHRVVQPWGMIFGDEGHDIRTDPPFKQIVFRQDGRVMKQDTEVFRLIFDTDPLKVEVKGSLSVSVAFDDPADPGSTDHQPFMGLYSTTLAVVTELLGMIGNQEHQPAEGNG